MEASKVVRVLICRVGQRPTAEDVPNKFVTWQELVRGRGEDRALVEFKHLDEGVQMICNEEGQHRCAFNCLVPGRAPTPTIEPDFVFGPEHMADPGSVGLYRAFGTFALSRIGDGGTGTCASLTDADIRKWEAVLRWMKT